MTEYFAGKTWVITGSLKDISRREASAQLEALGAKVTGSVSSKTDFLVSAEYDPDNVRWLSNKEKKARQLNIPIFNEAQLLAALSGGTVAEIEARAPEVEDIEIAPRDALESFRELAYGGLTRSDWDEICRLVDQCPDNAVEVVVDYLEGNLPTHPEPVLWQSSVGYAYQERITFQDPRALTPHWLIETLRGDNHPKLKLVRVADFSGQKINGAPGDKLLASEHLSELRVLNLSHNPTPKKFWAKVPRSPLFKHLKYLHIGRNAFDKRISEAFAEASFSESLTHLNLEEVSFQRGAAEVFFSGDFLSGLTFLRGDHLRAGREDLHDLLACAPIEHLRFLRWTDVLGTDEGFARLMQAGCLDGLEYLDLSCNFFSRAACEAIARSRALASLQHFSMHDNISWRWKREGEAPDLGAVSEIVRAPQLTNLRSLHLSVDNDSLGAFFEATHLDKLEHLHLACRDENPDAFERLLSAGHLSGLKSLWIAENAPSDFVGRLMRSEALPNLEDFNCYSFSTNMGDGGLMDLAAATHRANLKRFDAYHYGEISDEAAEAIRSSAHPPGSPIGQFIKDRLEWSLR